MILKLLNKNLLILVSGFVILGLVLTRSSGVQAQYDGNVLCSNGQYGDDTYQGNGDCEEYGKNVTVLPIETAAKCASLPTPEERVECADALSSPSKNNTNKLESKKSSPGGKCGPN